MVKKVGRFFYTILGPALPLLVGRCLIAATLGLMLLTACGTARQAESPPSKQNQSLILGVWTANSICPTIRSELNKLQPWAVQAANTHRGCIILGEAPPSESVQALVDLDGRGGACPSQKLAAGTRAVQFSGLGRQACMITSSEPRAKPPVAIVEWGILFDSEHSVGVNCEDQTNADLGRLIPSCRTILKAVVASLYKQ